MLRTPVVAAALVALAGCSATLPYTPERQPSGARVSAAYQVVGDTVKVEIDTGRRRVEETVIVKPDGNRVRAQSIEVVPRTTYASPISIGVGAGTFGGGVGTGVSVSAPVGGGDTTTDGNTFASFPAAEAGPAPWRLHLELAGVEPVVIVVGGTPDRRK